MEICIKTAKSQQKNRKQFASRPKGSPPHTLISCLDYTCIIYRFGCLKDLGPMRGKKTGKSLQNTKHNRQTYWYGLLNIIIQHGNSKPINICSNRTISVPYWKIMYRIVLQTIFQECKIKILKLIAVLLASGQTNLEWSYFYISLSAEICLYITMR